jgi:protein TonB
MTLYQSLVRLRSPLPPAAERVAPDFAAWSNVVPITVAYRLRPDRRAPDETIGAPERALPAPPREHDRLRLLGLAVAVLAVHAALFAFLERPPEPLPAIDLPAISVEIVMADSVASPAAAPSPDQSDPDPVAPDQVQPPDETPPVADADPTHKADQQAADQPDASPPPPDAPPVAPTATAEPTAPVALAESPLPASEAAPQPAVTAPAAQEPTTTPPQKPTAVPHTPPRPAVRIAQKPEVHAAHRPRRDAGPERLHAGAKPPQATTGSGSPSRAAPSPDPNYKGLVAAQLARSKQYPADARSAHSQGSAAISFTIDPGGNARSVRLVRGTGIASLDQEAQAMVHRASPFPPPPGGHAMNFNAPVNFRIQ